MKLESVGILMELKPLGERDSLATVLSFDYGLMRGVMRAAQIARKNKPLVGQIGAVSWTARLDSQLGAFHWESEKNLAAGIMLNPRALGLMNSAFALLGALLPEREIYQDLYSRTVDLLMALNAGGGDAAYLAWEIALLQDVGYALDLTKCSGCGRTEDLTFLSPRTGRAVCSQCGAPYITRLYRLPLTLDITLKFIDGACAQQGTQVPQSRVFLCRK